MMQKDKPVIKPLEFSDIDAIHSIENECFSTPWTKQDFEKELIIETAVFLVAHYENKVAGYINGRLVLDEFYINNVAVSSKYRRLGIGEKLIFSLQDYLKDKANFISLEVRESNLAAQKLYLKCGFEIVGNRKNFYQKPMENAVLMTKYFTNSNV